MKQPQIQNIAFNKMMQFSKVIFKYFNTQTTIKMSEED